MADSGQCSICFDPLRQPRTLRCAHQFCSECIEATERYGHYLCPTCRVPFKAVEGTQPRGGTMSVSWSSDRLEGYHNCGSIIIQYDIPSGVQTVGHPEPGNHYSGTCRVAYLPNNPEGNKVLTLLQRAFDARLTFTVGQSVTSGAKNTVVWNDIHHKTSPRGGPQCYGYPDPTYLGRIQEELAAKGITL